MPRTCALEIQEKDRLRLVVGGGNNCQWGRLALAFADAYRASLPLVAFEKFRIVIGLTFYAFPGEKRVASAAHSAEAEMSRLVSHSLPVAVYTSAQARLRNCNHNRIRNRPAPGVAHNAIHNSAIRAGHHVQKHDAAIHVDAGIVDVTASGQYGLDQPVFIGAA